MNDQNMFSFEEIFFWIWQVATGTGEERSYREREKNYRRVWGDTYEKLEWEPKWYN